MDSLDGQRAYPSYVGKEFVCQIKNNIDLRLHTNNVLHNHSKCVLGTCSFHGIEPESHLDCGIRSSLFL